MMKNDMSGGGAVFAAMLVLRDLDVPTKVTAHIMCTDNMPSGTAMKMGDVITHRDGTTVEV
jgi:leucyl aminopeptidase